MGKLESLVAVPSRRPGISIPSAKLVCDYIDIIDLTTVLFLSTSFLRFPSTTNPLTPNDPWEGLVAHCKDTQPIHAMEFIEWQQQLTQALHVLNGSAYIAEPGASVLFFGNISSASWSLSEQPLLLIVSPLIDQGEVLAQVTVLTPSFEADHARLLNIPGVEHVARVGIIMAGVDKAVHAELTGHGLGPYFTHRLGHGIGLEDHKMAYLRGGLEAIIQNGHAFSNEPGIYIKGKVGIHLEDCFYINSSGVAVYLTVGVSGQAKDPLHP